MSVYKDSGVPPKKDELGVPLAEDREDKTNPAWRDSLKRVGKSMQGKLDEKGQLKEDQVPAKVAPQFANPNTPGTTVEDTAPFLATNKRTPYAAAIVGAGIITTALLWARKTGKL